MKSKQIERPIEILLVEDNVNDVTFTRNALKEAKVNNNLHVAEDGVEALEFLKREGPFDQALQPDLILLDLNLPQKSGMEVLEEIKNDPNLRQIPVVIMTSSQAEQDIVKSYELQANCFIPKPVDFERFIDIIRNIECFWLEIVKLPGRA